MRTASEVRSVLDRTGGTLAGQGAVSFLFNSKGVIEVDASGKEADDLLMAAATAGADDVEVEGDTGLVYTKPEAIDKVKKALEQNNYSVKSSEISKEASSTVKITDEAQAEKVLSLVEKLEDLEDVQRVYANFDIATEVMEKVA